jgi:hypothetical protein
LKPSFKRRETPARAGRSAPAWFYGRLLLAALSEAWAGEGRFPPARESPPDKERRLTLVMVKYTFLESVSFMDALENMRHIAALCANSKRKRLRRFTGCSSLSKRIGGISPRRLNKQSGLQAAACSKAFFRLPLNNSQNAIY